MKVSVDCENTKPTNKSGKRERCACHYLNRNFPRELKQYKAFMKSLDKKK